MGGRNSAKRAHTCAYATPVGRSIIIHHHHHHHLVHHPSSSIIIIIITWSSSSSHCHHHHQPPSPSSSSPPPRLAYISAGALCRGGRGGRRIDRIHGDHVTAHRRLVGVKLLGEAARAVLARLARPVSARPAVRLQAGADGVRVCVRLWVLVQRAGHWAEASSPQPPLPRLHNRNPPPKKSRGITFCNVDTGGPRRVRAGSDPPAPARRPRRPAPPRRCHLRQASRACCGCSPVLPSGL